MAGSGVASLSGFLRLSFFSRKNLMKASITLLLFLNFLWLLTYFLRHPNPVNIHFHLHQDFDHPTSNPNYHHHHLHLHNHHYPVSHSSSKTWPILPSYLPWLPPNPALRVGSCEGFFGNGFTRTVDVVPLATSVGTSPAGSGWFRCHYSGTLRSSVCEGSMVRMDPTKIRMSKGGERIEEVIGRRDEDELPEFDPGAFGVSAQVERSKRAVSPEFLDKYLPQGEVLRHTMRELMGSIELVQQSELNCSEWIEEPTLLLTRFEYANVFHTYTDWYSAYVSSRVTGLPMRPHVIFVDGHSKTQLEETWEALFSSVRFAKNFSGPVCFHHAVFTPLGYETAWFKGLTEAIDCHGASARDLWANPDDSKTARLSEFGEMIKAAFDLPVEKHKSSKPPSEYNVLFVRREDYLAHPRHGGKVESRLSNEEEVFDSLKSWASNFSDCKVNLVNGLFAHMPMKEQIRAIQDASVIIGAHGAGLTHVVSALPKTVILEIISSQFQRPHFQLISLWKGLEYHAINLPGSQANPPEVIGRLKRIMKSIGC